MKSPLERIKEKVSFSKKNAEHPIDLSEIISTIKRLHSSKKLIPVICEDMFEYISPSGEHQSLHSYTVEKVIDKLYNRGIRIEFSSEKELLNIINEKYYGISMLKAMMEGRNVDLFTYIYDSIVDYEERDKIREGIHLKEEVKMFLEAGEFPLIITTNCFGIIENDLSLEYEPEWNKLNDKNKKDLPERCVYHLFGKADHDSPLWGYDDELLLKFLCSSYSADFELQNLHNAVNPKKNDPQTLLILGNDAPDWLFRFLLTPIYGDYNILYNKQRARGYYLNEIERSTGKSLDLFLHNIRFDKESDLVEVLTKVTPKIQKPSKDAIAPSVNKKFKYAFFVAHAGDDKSTAEKFVNYLRSKNLKVWVDFENLKEGDYWQRIIDALKNSAFFIPLVTGAYMQRMKADTELRKLQLPEIEFDPKLCVDLEKKLEGAQIELLLANKWYMTESLYELDNQGIRGYSIPVIIKGSQLYCMDIDFEKIRNWGTNSQLLPENLFFGKNMYYFDEANPESFKIDCERYLKFQK